MTDESRDLACEDFWQQSIARSQARRGLRPAVDFSFDARDLTTTEPWSNSASRSRLRREWRERHLSFGPIDGKRIAVPAALLAGGLAVGQVVTSGTGDAGGGVDATAASAPVQDADEARPERASGPEPTAAKRERRRAASKPAAPRKKAKPKPKSVVRTVAQAQSLGGFRRGMRGPAVVQLQRSLGVTADGIYGSATSRAVHRVQKRSGLNTDGIVGPATWRAVSSPRSSSTTRPAVHRSSSKRKRSRGASVRAASLKRGSEVEALQAKLGLPVDGDYGARTTAAVKRFQRRHGLRADGVVGAATWRAIGLSSGNRTLHPQRFGADNRKQGSRRSSPRRSRGGGGSGGGASSVVARAIAAANRIATKPYRYGGGHGSFDDTAYDCSGSVSYVLHGAGLLDAPLASGGFMTYGAPGPGKHITIYTKADHMFMTINGRRFDTGYGGNGNRWAKGSRPTAGYTVRHPPGL